MEGEEETNAAEAAAALGMSDWLRRIITLFGFG